jgi:hypothetical protein
MVLFYDSHDISIKQYKLDNMMHSPKQEKRDKIRKICYTTLKFINVKGKCTSSKERSYKKAWVLKEEFGTIKMHQFHQRFVISRRRYKIFPPAALF